LKLSPRGARPLIPLRRVDQGRRPRRYRPRRHGL
jgi:hypothetical protein